MALKDLLEQVPPSSKNPLFKAETVVRTKDITEDMIYENMDNLRDMISFYKVYPDIFIDHIKGPNCPFKFYFYQRYFLRSVMRYKYNYYCFVRGFSKSFLVMMSLMLKAIFYPGSKLAVSTGGKEF